MKTAVGVFAVTLVLTGSAAAGQIDELKAGKLQCYGPNTVRKTCAALSGYTFSSATVTNQAEVLVSTDPVGTMKTDSPVTIKGDAVCGTPTKHDIDAAVITVGGTPLTGGQADHVKMQIWASVAPRAGKEICTIYVPTGGGAYTTRYTLDGKPDDTPPVSVILVSPQDGYTVAP